MLAIASRVPFTTYFGFPQTLFCARRNGREPMSNYPICDFCRFPILSGAAYSFSTISDRQTHVFCDTRCHRFSLRTPLRGQIAYIRERYQYDAYSEFA